MGIRSTISSFLGFGRKKRSRKSSAVSQRLYSGANTSRLTADWVTSGSSADQEIKSSIKKLRNRSRQLCRDNDYARVAVRQIKNNVIGTGARLQAQVRMQRGKGRMDVAVNDAIERAWKQWGKKNTCNTAGMYSWTEMCRLCAGAMVESGEVILRIVRKPFGGGKIAFALEVMESDRLDEDYSATADSLGREWRMGVQVDKWQRPLQYAFLSEHPGDSSFPISSREKTHVFVDAKDVIHLFESTRPGQTRGVPWLASAIEKLHHLDGYSSAEIIRARAASALMGFVVSPEGELDPGGEVYNGERVTSFEPGVFKYLNPGENVTVPQLDSPSGEYEPFVRTNLRAMAAGLGISYESLSSDYSQTNYSSSRLSLLETRDTYRALQNYFVENLYERVYEAWMEMAVMSGVLNLAGYESEPSRYHECRWLSRGWTWVDPVKEVEAYKEAVRCGFTTQAEVLSMQGSDLEELLTARRNELDLAEALDLNFDTQIEEVEEATIDNVEADSSNDDGSDSKD